MRSVDLEELYDLSLGATLLGSGGGGSPDYDILMAEKQLEDYGKPLLCSLEELQDDAFVLPIAFAGAPLVGTEMLPSGSECEAIFEAVEQYYRKRPTHLLPAEIGGANALAPFLFAAKMGIPIIDGDTIGRAFPELQMSSCNLARISCSPAFVADSLGNSVIINSKDAHALENLARRVIVGMGSSALIGIYLMSGKEAKAAAVPSSISLAMALGRSIRESKKNCLCPIKTLTLTHQAKFIGDGIIDQIEQIVENGFLNGMVSILGNNSSLRIFYQNEYLKVEDEGKNICLTPDIIVVMDQESFCPITSEKLQWGLRVSVFSLPAPQIWRSEQGLKLVGPAYFGFTNGGSI